MRTVELSEAKRKLSKIIERASRGEQIGVTRDGELAAIIVPARREDSLKHIFAEIEQIRKRVGRRRNVRLKNLINGGRVRPPNACHSMQNSRSLDSTERFANESFCSARDDKSRKVPG